MQRWMKTSGCVEFIHRPLPLDNKPWVSVSPLSVTRSGKVITAIFYVPVTPPVIDTTAVDLQPNDGLEYDDSAHYATITELAITGPDTVQITLSTLPTVAGGELRYAFTGTPGYKADAHVSRSEKGNIRDSDTTRRSIRTAACRSRWEPT
jgi:hypothetical protein